MGLRGPDAGVYTVRLQVLGEELRGHREAAGLSLAEVRAKVGISTSKLSRMENGRNPLTTTDVAVLLGVYGVRGSRRADLVSLAHSAAEPAVRRGHAGGRASTVRLLESRASVVVDFQPLLVPPLLQTVPYAQAVLREVDMVDERGVEEHTAGRIHRQAVLRRDQPPRYYAILTETALRTRVGGAEVQRGQLRFLLEAGAKEHVTIRVVPASAAGHPGLAGSFQRIQFARRGAVVLLESRTSSQFVEDATQVRVYDRVTVELLSAALDESASAALIHAVAEDPGPRSPVERATVDGQRHRDHH